MHGIRAINLRDEIEIRGGNSGIYHYVLIGNKLRHVSRYCIGSKKGSRGRFSVIEYTIPADILEQYYVIKFEYSRDGALRSILKFRGTPESSEYPVHLTIKDLCNLEFEVLSKRLSAKLQEVRENYIPMLRDVNDFSKKLGLKIDVAPRLLEWLSFPECVPKMSLARWPDSARLKGVKRSCELVFQLWMFKQIHLALDCREVIGDSWRLRQSFLAQVPASDFLDSIGRRWFVWWEPQIVTLSGFRRPDILLTKKPRITQGLTLLVECKASDFAEWWCGGKILDTELRPYRETFKPKTSLLVTRSEVPQEARKRIEELGFIVVDCIGVKNFRHLLDQIRECSYWIE